MQKADIKDPLPNAKLIKVFKLFTQNYYSYFFSKICDLAVLIWGGLFFVFFQNDLSANTYSQLNVLQDILHTF